MTAPAMEKYVEELINAAWDPLGYKIEIWRQNGHVRTNLIAGLPPEEWSAITGREPPPPRYREET